MVRGMIGPRSLRRMRSRIQDIVGPSVCGRGGVGLGILTVLGALGLMLIVGRPTTTQAAAAPATTTYASCSQASGSFPKDLDGHTSGSATFNFPANCTIDLTGMLTVQKGVTITVNGSGLILDAQPRGFDVIDIDDSSDSPSTLTLNQVTVENGANGVFDVYHGYYYGDSTATVGLAGSTIRGNSQLGVEANTVTLTNSAVSGNGGVGLQASSATVTDSSISGNLGDGLHADIIPKPGNVTVTGSTVIDNGGVGIDGARTVTGSTVNGNGGDGIDGGTVTNCIVKDNGGFGISGATTATGSTVSGNIGDGVSAGAVINSTVSNNGGTGVFAKTVTSSTIIGNHNDGVAGDNATITDSTISDNGLYGIFIPGTATVTSSTFTGNHIDGILAHTLIVAATLLSGNKINCAVTSLTDKGYNLSTDGSCGFDATGSKNGVSQSTLHLLPLASNGGLTHTMALGPGSVAIDSIPLANGKCAVGSQIDQRGINRPQGSGCDIGAFEAIPSNPNNIYFSETGHFLSNGFLAFWQHFGGLAVFGYPISDEFQQNGLTVQYFQRARFEWHPGSDPARYDVELGLLGDQAAVTARQQNSTPFAPIQAASDANCNFYAPTGHRLCFGFRAYWESHGGLANFGYPISEEFTQKGLTVQYFERAVFEYHPNNPVAYQVELRLLGTELLGPQP